MSDVNAVEVIPLDNVSCIVFQARIEELEEELEAERQARSKVSHVTFHVSSCGH